MRYAGAHWSRRDTTVQFWRRKEGRAPKRQKMPSAIAGSNPGERPAKAGKRSVYRPPAADHDVASRCSAVAISASELQKLTRDSALRRLVEKEFGSHDDKRVCVHRFGRARKPTPLFDCAALGALRRRRSRKSVS